VTANRPHKRRWPIDLNSFKFTEIEGSDGKSRLRSLPVLTGADTLIAWKIPLHWRARLTLHLSEGLQGVIDSEFQQLPGSAPLSLASPAFVIRHRAGRRVPDQSPVNELHGLAQPWAI
jgi:hypothetical protein